MRGFFGLLLLLILTSSSFGATGPQEYFERPFIRQYALSDSSLHVDYTEGDRIRCFNASLTDTTGHGVDQTYVTPAGRKANWRYLWRFSMPDSAQICDCYEIAGSPDSLLLYHWRIPGKGFRNAANNLTTDAQGRWNPHVSVKLDTLVVGKRITTTDLATGAGTIGTTELADSLITGAKIPASTITAVKIAASAVGTSEISNGAILNADINASAAIDLTKLSTTSASTNSAPMFNGSTWAPALVDSSKITNATLSPTDLASNGAATGDRLVWNGTKWDNKDPIAELRWNGLHYADCNSIASTVLNSAYPWATAAISSGTMAMGTATANHPGVYEYYSSGTANSGMRIYSDPVGFLIGGGEYFEATFTIPTTTNVTCRLGYHDATTITAPVDGVWINIAGTTLDGRTSSNSTTSTTGTSYTITAATWYRATVQLNAGASTATFAVYNDAGSQLWTNTLSANIPTGAGRFCGSGVIVTESAGASQTLLDLDWLARWQSGRSFTR